MADLSNLLKKAKKNWGEAVSEAKKKGFAEWPDGRYIGQLISAEVKESSTGSFGVLFQYQIPEGHQENSIYNDWINLFDKDSGEITSFAVRKLEAHTGSPAEDLDIEELETILEDIVNEDQVWDFTLKTSKGKNGEMYQNMRLGKKLEGYASPDEEEKETPAPKSTSKPSSTSAGKAAEKPSAKTPASSATATTLPQEEEEGEEEEETVFSEGDEVTFTVKTGKGKSATSEDFTGVIDSIDEAEETAEVKVSTGRKAVSHTVSLSDLSKVEAEEEEEETEEETEDAPTYNEGDEVTFEVNGEQKTGKVVSVDEDEEEMQVKVGKKIYQVGFDDVITEEDEEDEEEVVGEDELHEGDTVEFEDAKTKKTLQGVVISFTEDTIKVKVGAKVMTVPGEDVTIIKTAD